MIRQWGHCSGSNWILKFDDTSVVLDAAKVYDIDELPDAVAKFQPARSSANWKEGYDQNEVEYAALKQVESFVIRGSSAGPLVRYGRCFL